MEERTDIDSDLLFQGPGEMRVLCRAFDWATTSLGPFSQWPISLRTAAQMVLASPFPNIIMWGPELIQIYNDGYREIMGSKHPAGLGQPTQQCWPEVWQINQPIYRRVWAGESFSFEDALYPITRSGQLQDAWFTLAYSPVRDESGQSGGVLVTVFETTDRVLEQRQRQKAQEALIEQKNQQTFLLALSDTLRPLVDRIAIQQAAMQLLGQHLQVSRAFYGDMQADQDTLLIGPGYASDTFPLEVQVRFSEFDADLTAYYGKGQTVVMDDVNDHPLVNEQSKAEFALIDCRAAVGVPLLKGEKVRSILSLHQTVPRHWTATDISLAQETAERTWAAVERARAEEALRQSEEDYRTLFETMEEGLNRCELVLDQTGQVVDCRFLDLNPAFERQTGMALEAVAGRLFSELFPEEDRSYWLDLYQQVFDTQSPRRFESYWEPIDRWLGGTISPAGEQTIHIFYEDVTQRKRAEVRQTFLLTLSDALRPLSDPLAIQETACRVLGQQLGANRVLYAETVEGAGEPALVRAIDYTNGVPSRVGWHRLDDYGRFVTETWRAGRNLLWNSLDELPALLAQERAAYEAVEIEAIVGVPLVKDGQFKAFLAVHQATARKWTADEIALVEETAERTWAAVERAKAEEALHKSEEQLRTVLTGIAEPFYALDRDWRFLFASRSALHLWDKQADQVLGRPFLEAFPQAAGSEAYAAHRRVMQTGTPERLETISPVVNRWVEIDFTPTPQGGLSVAFRDIQARKQAERRQAFLLKLSDALRPLSTSAQMERTATRVLGQELGVNRAFFATIAPDGDSWSIQHDYADGVPSNAGRYPWSDFQRSRLAQWQAGRMSSIADSEADPSLSAADRAAYAAFGTRAAIGVPLVKGGRFVGLLSVNQIGPRAWTEEELTLTGEAAERTWAEIERARAEEALRQSEAQLNAVFEVLPAGLALADASGKILRFNPALNQIWGVPPIPNSTADYAEWKARWVDTGQPLAAEDWAMAKTLRTGEVVPGDVVEIERFDGRRATIINAAAPIRDEAGRIVGGIVAEIDITAQRQAEQALRQSEENYRLLFESMDEGFYVAQAIFDQAGRCVDIFYLEENPAAVRMVGQSAKGRYMSELAPYEQYWRDLFGETARTGKPQRREEYAGPDGIWYEFYVFKPPQAQDDQFVLIFQDVTQRRQTQEALQQADQRKDEFLAMLAHELRNPMSTIRSGLQILTLTDGKDQTSRDTIAMMDRQTNHLVRMVDDLLDVSRISQGKIELKTGRVNLVELVAQAAESVQTLYQEQGRGLQVELPTVSIEVEGDGARLSQVVTNLLTNGARYTQEGGTVWLSLSQQNGRNVPAGNRASPTGRQEVLIQVRDNGIGLAADQLETIFELFVQVDNSLARSKGGLGLGLTLVKRLVEMHGGRVDAQSEGVGKGSTFTVHLPTVNTAPEPALTSAEGRSSHVSPQRILVVDDNADAALTLSLLLKLKGYEVHTRHSGQAALSAVNELKPGVVLLDIGMPDMDGYETARAIRQQSLGQDVILIALTGYGGEADKQRAREAGFDGHLVKPVDLGELTVLLTNLLSAG